MNLKQLIRSKFRKRWGDLELLILLEIGMDSVHYVQLVERTGASTSGIWNILQNHLLPDEMVKATKANGRTYYTLTVKGQRELHSFLKPPPRRIPLPPTPAPAATKRTRKTRAAH